MKSMLVFFVATLFLSVSVHSFADESLHDQGNGSAIFKSSSVPLILADSEFNSDDPSMNPKNNDNRYNTAGSSSDTGGSSSETGGSSNETGGDSSETGGDSSETGGTRIRIPHAHAVRAPHSRTVAPQAHIRQPH